MTRTCPFGQETTFLVAVHQPLLHLHVHLRIDQVEQGKETTEGVPEARVGEVVARTHFACVRTIMYGLALRINLKERAGEEHGAVEATVEGAQVVDVIVLYLDATQHFVPALAAVGTNLVEGTAAQFFQVLPCLLLTDKR